MKLAFVDKSSGSLAIADLNNGTTGIRLFSSNTPVYHPVISPNGKWVAYTEDYNLCSDIEAIQTLPGR